MLKPSFPAYKMHKRGLFFMITAIVLTMAVIFSPVTMQMSALKLGTFVSIKISGHRWYNFDKAFNAGFSEIDKINSMANPYDPLSEINIINSSAHITPVKVSKELFSLIEESIRLSKNTGGAFDITILALAKIWKGKTAVPSEAEIEYALENTGYDKLILDKKNSTIFFKKKGMGIDLSGIGKGYAVDKAALKLRELGVRSALVNAGGHLYCLGKKNVFMNWQIGIRNPRDEKRVIKKFYLKDKAAATSGGYEQHFNYEGRDYTHIIDPRTGYAKQARYISATVISSSCTFSDAIATAVCIDGAPLKKKIEKLYPEIKIILIEDEE